MIIEKLMISTRSHELFHAFLIYYRSVLARYKYHMTEKTGYLIRRIMMHSQMDSIAS